MEVMKGVAKRWNSERAIRDEGRGTIDPGDSPRYGGLAELATQVPSVAQGAERQAKARRSI